MKFIFEPVGSDGAQGSYFSLPPTITFLNLVALSHFLNGWKLASLIKTDKSDPENLKKKLKKIRRRITYIKFMRDKKFTFLLFFV